MQLKIPPQHFLFILWCSLLIELFTRRAVNITVSMQFCNSVFKNAKKVCKLLQIEWRYSVWVGISQPWPFHKPDLGIQTTLQLAEYLQRKVFRILQKIWVIDPVNMAIDVGSSSLGSFGKSPPIFKFFGFNPNPHCLRI
jgi:hypothetical protein